MTMTRRRRFLCLSRFTETPRQLLLELNADAMRRLVAEAVLDADFRAATFGGPARGGACPWRRVAVRPVELHGERWLQFSFFDKKKDITKNLRGPDAAAASN